MSERDKAMEYQPTTGYEAARKPRHVSRMGSVMHDMGQVFYEICKCDPKPAGAPMEIICPVCKAAECSGHTISRSSSATVSSGMARDLAEQKNTAPAVSPAPSEPAHFGLWLPKIGKWMMLHSGGIFWTTSRAVAEAQREFCAAGGKPGEVEVRAFPENQQIVETGTLSNVTVELGALDMGSIGEKS